MHRAWPSFIPLFSLRCHQKPYWQAGSPYNAGSKPEISHRGPNREKTARELVSFIEAEFNETPSRAMHEASPARHGGEASSVEFCHRAALNYVSASPFRVPVARLAAAQAVLHEKEVEVSSTV